MKGDWDEVEEKTRKKGTEGGGCEHWEGPGGGEGQKGMI